LENILYFQLNQKQLHSTRPDSVKCLDFHNTQ